MLGKVVNRFCRREKVTEEWPKQANGTPALPVPHPRPAPYGRL